MDCSVIDFRGLILDGLYLLDDLIKWLNMWQKKTIKNGKIHKLGYLLKERAISTFFYLLSCNRIFWFPFHVFLSKIFWIKLFKVELIIVSQVALDLPNSMVSFSMILFLLILQVLLNFIEGHVEISTLLDRIKKSVIISYYFFLRNDSLLLEPIQLAAEGLRCPCV